MQIQGVKNINFSSGRLTPEALEARATALENEQSSDFGIKPEYVADVLDGKLKKTQAGRKIVNMMVSGASFAAAAMSFKKVAPKLRHGIASATGKIASQFASFGKQVNNGNINQVADEMLKESSKIAQKGDGTLLRKATMKVLGEKNGTKALESLKRIGIETGGDVADTAIAIGAAVLAGREAGDIADGAQKEHTLRDALGDITKVMSVLPGVEVIPEIQ